MKKQIELSPFGAYVRIAGENIYLSSETDVINIARVIKKRKNMVVAQVSVTHKRRKCHIYSIDVLNIDLAKKSRKVEILENGWLQHSDSHFVDSKSATRRSIFLAQSYNPFSFKSEYGYVHNSIVSEWYTIIKDGEEVTLIGAVTTANQLAQIYLKDEAYRIRIKVTCQLDGISLQKRKALVSEEICIITGEDIERVKELFARELKKKMRTKKVKKPITAICSAYYWNKNNVSERLIETEIANIPDHCYFDFFTIDAGYSVWGDWQRYEKKFPRGLRRIVSNIHSKQARAGIWISPFNISPKSVLVKTHPNWIIRTSASFLNLRFETPFDDIFPGAKLYGLDISKKAVQKHICSHFQHFYDIGFRLFKLDFLYTAFMTVSPKKTRVELFREVMSEIRNVTGSDAYLMSAIAPLSPLVGAFDIVRTSTDVISPYVLGIPLLNTLVNRPLMLRSLEQNRARIFFDKILWNCDPDGIVLFDAPLFSRKIRHEQHTFIQEHTLSIWYIHSFEKMKKKSRKIQEQFLELFHPHLTSI